MSMTPLQARHSSLVPHSWKAGWFGGSLEVYLLSFSFPAKNVCRFWRFWHDWFSSIPPGTLLPWWWMCVYSSIDRWMQAPQSMDVDSVASHGPWFKLSKRGFSQSGLQGFLGLHQFSFDRKNNVTFFLKKCPCPNICCTRPKTLAVPSTGTGAWTHRGSTTILHYLMYLVPFLIDIDKFSMRLWYKSWPPSFDRPCPKTLAVFLPKK